MTAFFVAGAGTDIGKTWVAASLLRCWRYAGLEPAVIKPVASGYDRRAPQDSDGAALLTALGRRPETVQIEAITPFRLLAPLSPDQAAAREGVTLSVAAIAQACAPLIAAARGPVLIEGAGGVMSPLNAEETLLDLAAAFAVSWGAPCIFVCGSYLGAISHALTGLAVLRGAGIATPLLVVNETPHSPVDLAETARTLAAHAGDAAVVAAPRLCDDSVWRTASRALGIET
jgi:dethiobiotin synthetase